MYTRTINLINVYIYNNNNYYLIFLFIKLNILIKFKISSNLVILLISITQQLKYILNYFLHNISIHHNSVSYYQKHCLLTK